jgi:hypothetical protein
MHVVSFTVKETPAGYLAEAEGGSIVTAASDFESLKSMIRDALDCHFEPGDKPKSIVLTLALEEVTVP